MSTSKFPKFVPEEQTLKRLLELMNVADITDDAKKVNIILMHIPTKHFDDLARSEQHFAKKKISRL